MPLKGILSVLFVIATIGAFAQTTEETLTQSLQQKGLRLISKTELSEFQVNQILNFNFEEYRKSDKSLIIKVVEGLHLELFSKKRVATGEPDVVHDEKEEPHNSDVDSDHVHVPASQKKIKKFEVITLDIFGVSNDSESN